ncbi:MAG TPA: phytoene/squalene synthase family protein, partial [Thermoanaerobaculia bacterium]|nr:phytoene/squalene synthase family protein [Thermoanaerobaculia bacterium]
MPHWQPSDTATLTDRAYQEYILRGVSRTFALTIPELPGPLRHAVGNCYLLCRIADTIEDDPGLPPAAKRALWRGLRAAVAGIRDPGSLARDLDRALAPGTPAAERDLARNLPRVVRAARAESRGARRAVLRCLATMTEGMAHFAERRSPAGLPDVAELERYCYHVAGVVGELLTDLFAERLPALAARRSELRALAASFGAGLQMVNILKDVREDRERGVCWLPRSLFARHGVDLARLPPLDHDPRWAAGVAEMTGLAHSHLGDARDYILGNPA